MCGSGELMLWGQEGRCSGHVHWGCRIAECLMVAAMGAG